MTELVKEILTAEKEADEILKKAEKEAGRQVEKARQEALEKVVSKKKEIEQSTNDNIKKATAKVSKKKNEISSAYAGSFGVSIWCRIDEVREFKGQEGSVFGINP